MKNDSHTPNQNQNKIESSSIKSNTFINCDVIQFLAIVCTTIVLLTFIVQYAGYKKLEVAHQCQVK